ncbi:hypothetical protein HGM15179_008949 [Zosterops borbonicus]|uniref:Uncharacterized protein n=1 Tax=Zosterops borbonicus TaxID=364589 RepID=A0A8K1LLN5_9PASS|nr:hypothetical protein HGM15179_008949 [Zosterops borbonicus]
MPRPEHAMKLLVVVGLEKSYWTSTMLVHPCQGTSVDVDLSSPELLLAQMMDIVRPWPEHAMKLLVVVGLEKSYWTSTMLVHPCQGTSVDVDLSSPELLLAQMMDIVRPWENVSPCSQGLSSVPKNSVKDSLEMEETPQFLSILLFFLS